MRRGRVARGPHMSGRVRVGGEEGMKSFLQVKVTKHLEREKVQGGILR